MAPLERLSAEGTAPNNRYPWIPLDTHTGIPYGLSMNTPPSFEWDDAKATANFIKHGVSFDAGSRVFLDDNRLDIEDTRFNYGEERRNVTGVVDGVCLTITYTLLPSIPFSP